MVKQYEKYKVSGIDWIGTYPNKWNLVRLRYLCDITTGSKDTINRDDEGEYPFFVRSKTIERISTYSYDGEAILTAGDGDICKIWHHVNAKFDFHQRVYMLYNFKNVIGRFLYYFISENFYYDVFKLSAKNTVDSLRLPMFQNFPVLVPTLQEQTQIARYLDHQTDIINQLIQQKEKLIELLKEKRQAVINEAVTKGLNPNAKMKDSGIEWWGKIPEHWQIKRLKYLFSIKKEIAGELGHNVLSVTQKGIKIRDLDNLKGQLSMDYSKYQLVEKGEFIMNHMDLLTGYIDISLYDGVTSPDYRVFKAKNDLISKEFYLSLFQFCYSNRIFFGQGQGVSDMGRWRMPSENFNNFPIPFPPFEEQKQIASYIQSQTMQIDTLIDKQSIIIEKLKEYRQSLISEVVTGKVDVREWEPTN